MSQVSHGQAKPTMIDEASAEKKKLQVIWSKTRDALLVEWTLVLVDEGRWLIHRFMIMNNESLRDSDVEMVMFAEFVVICGKRNVKWQKTSFFFLAFLRSILKVLVMTAPKDCRTVLLDNCSGSLDF